MPDQIQAAELLPLTTTSQEQLAAAASVTERHAPARANSHQVADRGRIPKRSWTRTTPPTRPRPQGLDDHV